MGDGVPITEGLFGKQRAVPFAAVSAVEMAFPPFETGRKQSFVWGRNGTVVSKQTLTARGEVLQGGFPEGQCLRGEGPRPVKRLHERPRIFFLFRTIGGS